MINLDKIDAVIPTAEDNSKGSNSEGGLTIIYHKSGKRIVFSKRVCDMLGSPENVNMLMSDEYLIILAENNGRYKLKDTKNQKVIYNANLIVEILTHFNIEYDEHFCKTFSSIEEVENTKNAVAIKMCDQSGDCNENNNLQ